MDSNRRERKRSSADAFSNSLGGRIPQHDAGLFRAGVAVSTMTVTRSAGTPILPYQMSPTV